MTRALVDVLPTRAAMQRLQEQVTIAEVAQRGLAERLRTLRADRDGVHAQLAAALEREAALRAELALLRRWRVAATATALAVVAVAWAVLFACAVRAIAPSVGG